MDCMFPSIFIPTLLVIGFKEEKEREVTKLAMITSRLLLCMKSVWWVISSTCWKKHPLFPQLLQCICTFWTSRTMSCLTWGVKLVSWLWLRTFLFDFCQPFNQTISHLLLSSQFASQYLHYDRMDCDLLLVFQGIVVEDMVLSNSFG